LAPDHLEPLERAAAGVIDDEPRASDGRSGCAALAGLRVAEVENIVAPKLRVQHHVAQSALTGVHDLRYARHLALATRLHGEELQRPALLGHQQTAVGQELHCPGIAKGRDGRRDERVVLRAREVVATREEQGVQRKLPGRWHDRPPRENRAGR
jgi:hypothetical protein